MLAIGLCTLLLAIGGIKGERVRGEFYPLLLISVWDIMLTASAADLPVVYLGLEMVFLPLWALTMLGHRRGAEVEAAVKFFDSRAFWQRAGAFCDGAASTVRQETRGCNCWLSRSHRQSLTINWPCLMWCYCSSVCCSNSGQRQ